MASSFTPTQRHRRQPSVTETTLRYLSAVGNVGGCVVHVPVTGPEAQPGFLGSEPQLQQTVKF